MVNCKDQEELDYYWNKLSEGGDPKAQQCGWLKDKFGLSWQIVPSILPRLMDDKSRAGRVMSALMQMKKLDIKALEEA
jgi:predicted 3-demethylubiquinone-9 3-methyltransferase (glyoxalase superfamily)